jgi:hypothetical protein
MNQKLWLAALLGLMITSAANNPALAVRCGAKTCIQALNACRGGHCNEERKRNCQSYCQSEYDRCLQTGEFRGNVCGLKTKLIRK